MTVADYLVTDPSSALDECGQYAFKLKCGLRPLVKDHYATITN